MKLMNSALNCEAYYSSLDESSDHREVSANIHLNLRQKKKQTIKDTGYDNSSHAGSNIRNQYTRTIRNKSLIIQETSERNTWMTNM